MLQRLNPIVLVAGFRCRAGALSRGIPRKSGRRLLPCWPRRMGRPWGGVIFTQLDTGVLVATDAKGLPPGGHTFTIHEIGACTPDLASIPVTAGVASSIPTGSWAGLWDPTEATFPISTQRPTALPAPISLPMLSPLAPEQTIQS